MKKKAITLFALIIVATVALFLFIRFNNDHRECEQITEKLKNAKGEIVLHKRHVCKETFSF